MLLSAADTQQFPEHDLLQGTVNELKSEFDWNAILSINVLEHIEEDEAELASLPHACSQPARGALCLFVPAKPEIYAPIDKDFGHFRRYTRPELGEKLKGAGFEPVLFRYYNFVGYFAWWLSFCLLKKNILTSQRCGFSIRRFPWFMVLNREFVPADRPKPLGDCDCTVTCPALTQ